MSDAETLVDGIKNFFIWSKPSCAATLYVFLGGFGLILRYIYIVCLCVLYMLLYMSFYLYICMCVFFLAAACPPPKTIRSLTHSFTNTRIIIHHSKGAPESAYCRLKIRPGCTQHTPCYNEQVY